MMRNTHCRDDAAVSNLLGTVLITGILVGMFIVITLAANLVFIEGPSDNLKFNHYVDIGNGVSTRVVDLYVIVPKDEGARRIGDVSINMTFDLPDDVAGRDYQVMFSSEKTGVSQQIIVTDGSASSDVASNIAIAGIGETLPARGSTSGNKLNHIRYSSGGF